jgi:transcriptional regulator with XRE-family HTH domain
MISKDELGRRIREARSQRGMTLKQLDQSSGFSATHISEIERGKTSPTIGALIRIANALGKEPSFFIEEELLPEIAMIPREKRESIMIEGCEGEYLTPGIPGGRLRAYLIRLRPDGTSLKLPGLDGEEGGYVVKGEIEIRVEGKSYNLSEGDAIHHATEDGRELRASGTETAEIILITTATLKVEENEPAS